VPGWTKAHSLNRNVGDYGSWDVVLLGDEFVEDFNGRALGKPMPSLKNIGKYWDSTFTFNGGGDVEGLALGISGDSVSKILWWCSVMLLWLCADSTHHSSTHPQQKQQHKQISNLLWRTQHGELPDSKVYWIHIGTHDFGKGQCSEEAVLLGILRLAELIHEERPGSVIVLNSILPRKDSPNNKKKKNNPNILWRAIQEVNAQLESFCVHHEHLVYFDASPLFVNSNLPAKKNAKNNKQVTLRNPMYLEDKFHLSLQGHKTWGNAILERLKLILYDDDESST